MKKQIFIFLFCLPALALAAKPAKKKTAPAASAKPLTLVPGKQWVLNKDLVLKKTGLTPEEFVPYTNNWNLKRGKFMPSSSMSVDSCEFRTAISKKILKAPAVTVKKAATFQITNVQETTMSILIDMTSREARKASIDQIQVTCSAYEQGLDSPEQKEQFKNKLSASLTAVFSAKN